MLRASDTGEILTGELMGAAMTTGVGSELLMTSPCIYQHHFIDILSPVLSITEVLLRHSFSLQPIQLKIKRAVAL